MATVSVITPLLTIDHLFKECVASVLLQEYRDLEWLIVTGNADSVVDYFAKVQLIETGVQNRVWGFDNEELCEVVTEQQGSASNSTSFYIQGKIIKIITTKELHAGVRRNLALEQATGKYVLFLDGDDYFFSSTSIATLVSNIEKLGGDLLGGSCLVRDEAKQTYVYRSDLMNYSFTSKHSFTEFQNESGFYRFIYRKSFLQEKHLQFPNLDRFQDSIFLVHNLEQAHEFYLIPDIVYVYRKGHKQQIWTTVMYQDHMRGVFDLLNYASSHNYNKLQLKMLRNIKNSAVKRAPLQTVLSVADFRKQQMMLITQLLKHGSLVCKFPREYYKALRNLTKGYFIKQNRVSK